MDHLSMQTNYQRKLDELEPKIAFLRNCTKDTDYPCTCERYPYYHAISAPKAFSDRGRKELDEARKKMQSS